MRYTLDFIMGVRLKLKHTCPIYSIYRNNKLRVFLASPVTLRHMRVEEAVGHTSMHICHVRE